MSKTVGIIGGMGPKATADLFNKIIHYTDASCDQEHLHILVDSNSQIPDRSSYILGKGENPIKKLTETAMRLKDGGAEILIMPCNTAHYFYDELTECVNVPFINMIEEVEKYIVKNYGKCKVGLLATLGTYEGKIYEKYCKKYGIEIVVPTKETKEKLFDAIYKVKAGEKNFNADFAMDILNEFKEKKIRIMILGCTELPLIFEPLKNELKDFEFISSTDILAKKTVEIASQDNG